MARERTLKVVIAGDADKLARELKRSGDDLDRFGKQTRLTASITSKGFAAVRVGAAGAAAGIAGLGLGVKSLVEAAAESEKSQARLASQLKALDISYAAHRDEIDKVIQKQSQLAGLDDEDLQDAFTAIVRSTGDVSKALGSMAVVADLARAKNMDVAKAGEFVAKIHAGNVGGLHRLGIEFTKTTENVDKLKASNEHYTPKQLVMAKALDQSANSAKALGLLQDKLKGQAEAYGKTAAGSIDRADVAWENLKETLGEKLVPIVTKGADALGDFVTEMQDGTGKGGEFVDTLKDAWSEAKPVVMWIGRATKNVAEFASEHPNVAKLAASIVGVGVAVKALKFASSVTGFTDLVKGGRAAASTLKSVLSRGGTAAGTAAAENAAEALVSTGKFGAAGRSAGTTFSRSVRSTILGFGWRGVGAGIAASIAVGLSNELGAKIRDTLGLGSNDSGTADYGIGPPPGMKGPRSPWEALKGLFGRNTGGPIPGVGNTDTVPAMLTPGEHVWTKQEVQAAGGHDAMYAMRELFSTGRVQRFALGGIVQRANSIDAKGYPYVLGGGHGKTGQPSGGPPAGFDCSGAVSAVLGVSPRVSAQFASFGLAGPGKPGDTKIYANAKHVFAVINGRGWGTSRDNPGGGPGWLSYNHRDGFTIRHLADSGGASGGGGVGDPEETSEPGVMTLRERQERAGSRLVNRIAARYMNDQPGRKTDGRHGGHMVGGSLGIRSLTRRAASLGTAVEDADTRYGQVERRQGQSDEDLGTADGREHRLSEIAELKKLKQQQLKREKERAKALKQAIDKYDSLMRDVHARLKAKDSKGNHTLKGPARAKVNERLRAYDDRLTDLKAEAKALKVTIKDTELDIGDLDVEKSKVEGTPDTPTEQGPTPTDQLGQALSDIDLQERAGVMSSDQAQAARLATLQGALGGAFGSLDQRQQWEVMGQLRDVQQASAQAVADNTAALRDLQRSIDEQTRFAERVVATENYQLARGLADVVSGQIAGFGVAGRALTAGSGQLARY